MRHRAELGVLGNDDEVVETTSAKKISKNRKKFGGGIKSINFAVAKAEIPPGKERWVSG